MTKIKVQETDVAIVQMGNTDYISMSDMAKQRDITRTDYIIHYWLRTIFALEFLGLWEQINNPNFNSIEFDGIKIEAGLNSFVITPNQWIEKTNAAGIISNQGRYDVTYAHNDFAFKFGLCLSPEFMLTHGLVN